MDETRLEKSLRALAWAAVAATVLTLLAMGLFLIHPSKAGANRIPITDTTEISLEEDLK